MTKRTTQAPAPAQPLHRETRAAIVRALALLDSVAFVSREGDTLRPLAGLRAALERDDEARRAELAAKRRARRSTAAAVALAGPIAAACAEPAAGTRGAAASATIAATAAKPSPAASEAPSGRPDASADPSRPFDPAHDSAAAFFYRCAGFAWDPATETEENGRRRCARELADAERVYRRACGRADVACEWSGDADAWADYRADARRGGRRTDDSGNETAPQTIECAAIVRRDDAGNVHILASLGAIEDADDDARRVIRAELARECIEDLRELADDE